ncbi:MAG: hypothetical protein WBL95_03770 [Microcoleus sp.]
MVITELVMGNWELLNSSKLGIIAVLNLGEVCPMPYALCPLIKRAPHCY